MASTSGKHTHGPLARLARRLHLSSSNPEATGQSDSLVVTCEACGTANEVDSEKGRDEAMVQPSYFERPCAKCGRELGAVASRRYV